MLRPGTTITALIINEAANDLGLGAGVNASPIIKSPGSNNRGLANMQNNFCRLIGGACFAICLAAAPAAFAGEKPACDQFAWPITREREAFSAANLQTIRAGVPERALPEHGVALKLDPATNISYPVALERKPKNESSFGGVLTFASPTQPGTYQVTLSGEAWIDVIQNGRPLPSKAHSGKRDCPGVRKSVRFELQDAPLVVQLSDVPSETIKIAILPAE